MLNFNPTKEEVMKLVEEHCAFLKLPFKLVHMSSTLEYLWDREDAFIVTYNNDGYFIGFIAPHPLLGEPTAMELGLYSRPGAKCGKKMIEAFENWARYKLVKRVNLTSQSHFDLDQYYSRLGYTCTEKSYTKELA